MRGVAFLTIDRTLGYRSEEFLQENPSFAKDNEFVIVCTWILDTSDVPRTTHLLRELSRLKLPAALVGSFCKDVGINVSALRTI